MPRLKPNSIITIKTKTQKIKIDIFENENETVRIKVNGKWFKKGLKIFKNKFFELVNKTIKENL